MNLFSSNWIADDEISVYLHDEPEFYTSGDRVCGTVVILNRNWRQMNVEVLLICEEHAELNPLQTDNPDFENRRLTVAGETVDGEVEEHDEYQYGVFPFMLRLVDDPQSPYLLPSYEVECGTLVNAIRWLVEARVTYKTKTTRLTRDITVIPSRPLPVSDQQKLIKQEARIRAFKNPALSALKTASFTNNSRQIGNKSTFMMTTRRPRYSALSSDVHYKSAGRAADVEISAILQIPDYGLRQSPETIPMKLIVFLSEPQLVAITQIKIVLFTEINCHIKNQESDFSIKEELASPLSEEICPSNEIVDLSSHISSCAIENACPGFDGKWLRMKHQLKVMIFFEAIERREYKKVVTLLSDIKLLPPHFSDSVVDAPPRYTPPYSPPSLPSSQLSPPPHMDNRTSQIDTAGLGVLG